MTRLISALVGIPVVAAAVTLSGPLLFALVVLLLTALALAEYLRLCGVGGALGNAVLAGGAVAAAAAGTAQAPLVTAVALLLAVGAAVRGVDEPSRRFPEAAEALLGMFYIGYAFASLHLLRDLPSGRAWVMILLAVFWAGDSAAYYGGTLTGRRKLSPVLSPNKTWEGAAWGLAGSVAAGALLAPLLVGTAGAADGALLGLLAGAAGQVGDLFQSLWKRSRGVKDSGSLIPGHGGILDRIDSLLLGAPVGYNLVKYWTAQ